MSVTGTVKERVQYWVEDAIGGFVTIEWWVNIGKARDEPQSTIKFGKQKNLQMTYGEEIPESGVFKEVPFSIRVSDILERQYPQVYPPNHHAMDAAEVLLDYLYARKSNETEKTTYYIYNIYDLELGEIKDRSTVRNRKMGAVLVSGKLLVKYVDL